MVIGLLNPRRYVRHHHYLLRHHYFLHLLCFRRLHRLTHHDCRHRYAIPHSTVGCNLVQIVVSTSHSIPFLDRSCSPDRRFCSEVMHLPVGRTVEGRCSDVFRT
jgi:hypothetical protein